MARTLSARWGCGWWRRFIFRHLIPLWWWIFSSLPAEERQCTTITGKQLSDGVTGAPTGASRFLFFLVKLSNSTAAAGAAAFSEAWRPWNPARSLTIQFLPLQLDVTAMNGVWWTTHYINATHSTLSTSPVDTRTHWRTVSLDQRCSRKLGGSGMQCNLFSVFQIQAGPLYAHCHFEPSVFERGRGIVYLMRIQLQELIQFT